MLLIPARNKQTNVETKRIYILSHKDCTLKGVVRAEKLLTLLNFNKAVKVPKNIAYTMDAPGMTN